MRRDPKTDAADFFTFARDYLRTYMPTIRHLSPRTIEAYRISLECFLTFLTDHEHIDRAQVSFDHFDRARLKAWLIWLADDKRYATRTVTLRLTAIKAFLAYAAAEDVTLVALSQAARSLKAPTAPRKPIEYLAEPGDACRPRRVHRTHGEITPQPDAVHPALRHRRQSR